MYYVRARLPRPYKPRPVAQLAEHSSPKRAVVGSIPTWPA